MTKSQHLLVDYLTHGSETAFRELVTRYTDLVYSTALRLVGGDTHRAEDVAQTVFVDLARLARKLSAETMLGGWLYRHTCFVAAKAMRGERRRQARERQAVEMNALEDHSEANFKQIAPVLDEAINQLAPEDQTAILLRFFEHLNFASVGEALGGTEEAARKRVNRALDKLHDLLTARGVTLSATALGSALATRAVEAAPGELVTSLASAALSSAAAGHGTTLSFLKLMTTSKVSLSVAGAVVLAGATYLAWTRLRPLLRAKPTPLALSGTWTVLSKPQPLGHVIFPTAIALNREGELYVTDIPAGGRIQKRDLNGNWTAVTVPGRSPGGFKDVVQAMAFDGSGSLYLAAVDEGICKRDNQGNWTILATKGKELGQINWPRALTLDREGNLYIAQGWGEESGLLLRKPDGQWTRLAGHGNEVGDVIDPQGLAVDAEGNLYIADKPPDGKRIQKRDRTGRWSVVDEDAMSVGGLGVPLAPVVSFEKMTSDASGALYVSTTATAAPLSGQLLKRDTEGRWIPLAAKGSGLGQVIDVSGMSVDSAGALYVTEHNRIQKRDPNGTWTVVCEALKEPGAFVTAKSLALDSRGNLYVVDYPRRQVQKRDPKGRWTVVVDVPNEVLELHDPSFPVGVDLSRPLPFWLPAFRLFREPSSVAVDREDNLYVADDEYHRVMKLNTLGQWELCVPSGRGVGKTDGPQCFSVDASGNLYVADGQRGGRLQKRDPEGHWTGFAAPGPGQEDQIFSFCAEPNGNVYVLGWQGVWMRDLQGVWKVLASQGTEIGQVGGPGGLAIDSSGRLYVVDNGNHRLQIRDLDGRWSVLGATNSEGSPRFMEYHMGILVDRRGVVYVTDSHRVFRWTPQPGSKAAAGASEKKK